MTFIFFNPQVPTPSTDRYLYTITITKPDGSNETLPPTGSQGIYNQAIQDGKFVSDSTGAAWTTWVPTQIGNHSATVKFWGTAVPHTGYSSTMKEIGMALLCRQALIPLLLKSNKISNNQSAGPLSHCQLSSGLAQSKVRTQNGTKYPQIG